MIKIECMYCHKDMGSKDGRGVTGTSHSICPECYEKVMAELKNSK